MADFPGLFKALLVSALFHLVLLWPAMPAPGVAASVALHGHLRPVARAHVQMEAAAPSAPRLAVPAITDTLVAVPVAAPPAGVRPDASTVAATLALPEQTAGVDAGGVRQYRVSLAARLAGQASWRVGIVVQKPGRVVVAVQLLPGSQMPRVTLVESDMDGAVSQAVLQAARFSAAETALPGSLIGQAWVLHLPFEFAP